MDGGRLPPGRGRGSNVTGPAIWWGAGDRAGNRQLAGPPQLQISPLLLQKHLALRHHCTGSTLPTSQEGPVLNHFTKEPWPQGEWKLWPQGGPGLGLHLLPLPGHGVLPPHPAGCPDALCEEHTRTEPEDSSVQTCALGTVCREEGRGQSSGLAFSPVGFGQVPSSKSTLLSLFRWGN